MKHGGPVQAGMLRGMARAQKRHSQAAAMMGLALSFDGLDLVKRRLPSGASPNLVGRKDECRLKQKGAYYLDLAPFISY